MIEKEKVLEDWKITESQLDIFLTYKDGTGFLSNTKGNAFIIFKNEEDIKRKDRKEFSSLNGGFDYQKDLEEYFEVETYFKEWGIWNKYVAQMFNLTSILANSELFNPEKSTEELKEDEESLVRRSHIRSLDYELAWNIMNDDQQDIAIDVMFKKYSEENNTWSEKRNRYTKKNYIYISNDEMSRRER